MGDGCTIHGAWKGFREFREMGFVEQVPKMLGVQAEGAAAIHDAFHEYDSADELASTRADSIAVGRPRNTVKALRAVDESGGSSVTVSDGKILRAEKLLGSTEGLYAEPAGAVPAASVRMALREGLIKEDESVVVVVTGNGLKDTESAMEAFGTATEIEPDIEAVSKLYTSTD